jgi:hypothetical protein
MTDSNPSFSFEEISKREDEELLDLLESKILFSMQLSDNFNWLGLAEIASLKVAKNLHKKKLDCALKWAENGISIYEFLSFRNDEHYDSLSLSSMRLRVNMIMALGNNPLHSVLDVEKVFSWFREKLNFSYEEALSKAENSSLVLNNIVQPNSNIQNPDDISEILELRKIKNRLNLIQALAEDKENKIPDDLKNWLSIKNCLP